MFLIFSISLLSVQPNLAKSLTHSSPVWPMRSWWSLLLHYTSFRVFPTSFLLQDITRSITYVSTWKIAYSISIIKEIVNRLPLEHDAGLDMLPHRRFIVARMVTRHTEEPSLIGMVLFDVQFQSEMGLRTEIALGAFEFGRHRKI